MSVKAGRTEARLLRPSPLLSIFITLLWLQEGNWASRPSFSAVPLLLRFPHGVALCPCQKLSPSSFLNHPHHFSGSRYPGFIPSGSKEGTSGRERAGPGGQQAVHQGLETQAGTGRFLVPSPQHEMPKSLGWRDDGTCTLRWAHSLSSGLSC